MQPENAHVAEQPDGLEEFEELRAQDDDGEFLDDLKPGTKLLHGQYTIEEFLNAGGFGITYTARDSLNRLVVIKECFPDAFCRRNNASVQPRSRTHQQELKSIVRLFAREAQSLAKVGHPNIVGVHQVFEDNNTAYMALDFVRGRDLLDIIKTGDIKLSPDQIRVYLEKLLDAIGFVHSNNLLHRDISPDNIIIREDGQPVLIDFGAAREQATRASRVLSALRVVKDGYSPQEFYVSGSEQTPSCDLYSLAASFYHIITGDLPPDSQVRLAAYAAGDPDPYVPLSQRTTDFDQNFCDALDKAMSVLPKERVQSAADWVAMMNGEMAIAKPSAPVSRVTPTGATSEQSPKKTGMMLLLGATALVAAAGLGLYVTKANETEVTTGARSVTLVATPVAATNMPEFGTAPEPVAPVSGLPSSSIDASVEFSTVAALPPVSAGTPFSFDAPASTVPTVSPNAEFVVAPQQPVVEEPLRIAATGLTGVHATSPVAEVPEVIAQPAVDPVPDQISAVRDVAIPFALDVSDPNRIGAVFEGAPEWMKPGDRIVSVNGAAVASLASLGDVALADTPEDAASVDATFGVLDPETGAVADRSITLPVAYETVLETGLAFRATFEDGVWVTRVVAAPVGSAIREGDVIVADMGGSRRIDGPDTISQILAASESSPAVFSFAINRDGAMWVETLRLSAL